MQVPFSKPYINCYTCRKSEPTFGANITASEKFQFHVCFKTIEKNQLYYELFNFNLTVKYIQLYNFRLSNCLWTRKAYRLVVRKAFLFQMLAETFVFTLLGKVPLWQKCQNDVLCGNMNMNVSLIYWNLTSSSKILVLQRRLGFMLVYCSQKVKWYTFQNRLV